MSERITTALRGLADAVIDEANDSIIKPIISGAAQRSVEEALFGKEGIFTALRPTTPAASAPAPAAAKPTPKPADTTDAKEMARVFIGDEKVDAIITLKKAGKSDEAIAEFLSVSVDAVRLF